MKMITGGAFQGKGKCAEKLFGIHESDMIDGAVCIYDEAFNAVCIKNYHELLRRLLTENVSLTEFTKQLCIENSSVVIIMNEIGSGIVPLEKSERILREETGRAGCIIAEHSDVVVRVLCGIPMIIKGELNDN